MQKDKRSIPRISANVSCMVNVDDGKHLHKFNGIVKDISQEGICIVLDNAEKTYDIIRQSYSITVQFVGPIDETLAKESFQITLLSKWYSKQDGQVYVGGLY